ncbi:MAG: RDD family protein [Deltaproteobacteria bacterium]|nr:RDD family protein [Deltaproteobacteria bacterium]
MEIDKNNRKSRILMGEAQCSMVQRVIARFIDLIVTTAIFLIGSWFWFPLGWIGAVLYTGVQDSLGQGQSLGKKIIGLKVIEDYSGLPCSVSNSVFRNVPWMMSAFFLPFPVVGVLALFILIPLLSLEIYLVLTLDSGVRLGDVMGNTLVIESHEALIGAP